MSRRLLVITRHTPLPWEDGAGAYLFDLLAYLSAHGFDVTIAWTQPHDHLRWRGWWKLPSTFTQVAHLRAPGAWSVAGSLFFPAVYWQPFVARSKHAIKTMLSRFGLFDRSGSHARRQAQAPDRAASAPRTWMSEPDASERAFIAEMIRDARPDVVLANYAWLLPAIPASFTGLRACVHADVAWQRAALSAPPDTKPEFTPEVEAKLLSTADVIAAISATDATELARLAPRARVVLAPKSVAPAPLPPAPAGSTRVLFVGSDNAFNAEGLAWFLASVWPFILRRVPAARLDLCGSIARALPKPLPAGVDDHGPVTDLAPFYREAAVVVVPLLRATGLNIKLVEAAGLGRAVVATETTLEGAPFLRDAVALADTASVFADSVVRLIQEPAARDSLSAQARAAVAGALSPKACYARLSAALGAKP
jgi:glycosyltransferase involved in cell wall biosynthesis